MSDLLATLGQAAAFILLLYLMVLILIGLALRLGLMLGMSWVREKAELIKRLRPTVDSVNTTTEAAVRGVVPAQESNKVIRAVAELPVYVHTADQKVEQGSEKVADAVIEFRARTEMAKAVVKAFFSSGLKAPEKPALEEEGVGFRSPGYRMLVDEKAPVEASTASRPGEGYAGTLSASQLKGGPVEVVASPPKEIQPITATTQGVPPTENVPTNN
jgi:hypothetical protein